jgi:hypothetical protein
MAKVTLEIEIVNRVLAYLADKPYAEVHELINQIQTTAVVVNETVSDTLTVDDPPIEENNG